MKTSVYKIMAKTPKKPKKLRKDVIEKIATQAIDEVSIARKYKQGKITNWQKNEQMYYGVKQKAIESRANVALGRMQEFVHTLLSKIDHPLTFKFVKRKPAQQKRVEYLNALKVSDQSDGYWDLKDIVGKKQGIIYGRAIYAYFAESPNKKYKSHLEPIDVYDFLIDPSAGGIDIEQARFLGSYSVELDERQLKEGAKSGKYHPALVKDLLSNGSGNADDKTQEETNKRQRSYSQDTIGDKDVSDPTKYKFWRWCTTFQEDGERYYLLMDNSGRAIRCEKLVNISPVTDTFPLGAWPYWTWAAFPDLTEFWTPSYCDYAREIFMAQEVSLNQLLDNAEAINKPQKVVNTKMMKNLSQLKYRRDGIIKVTGDVDVNKAIQFVKTPSINTPIEVFNLLEGIQEKASGVNSGSKGVADEKGRLGIYEGNQAETADRFGLLNKSYAFGYKRFAKLWERGVREHLTQKVAVDIVGPEGVMIQEVGRDDLFRDDEEFGLIVEASNAEQISSLRDKTAKINFLRAQANNKGINQEKSFEIQAKIAGLTEDEIEQLQDVSVYGNSELMGECERDIEKLLDDDDVEPNEMANNAYKQKMVNYMRNHKEDITQEQFNRLADYIVLLDPIIMRNEARAFQNQQIDLLNQIGQDGGRAAKPDEDPAIEGKDVPLPSEPITLE